MSGVGWQQRRGGEWGAKQEWQTMVLLCFLTCLGALHLSGLNPIGPCPLPHRDLVIRENHSLVGASRNPDLLWTPLKSAQRKDEQLVSGSSESATRGQLALELTQKEFSGQERGLKVSLLISLTMENCALPVFNFR